MTDTFHSQPGSKISGDLYIPGDKSISHRAIILSSIAEGVTEISHLCMGDDVLNTITVMRALGVQITVDADKKLARVKGVVLHGLKPSKTPLNCGNSGTAMRLLCGLLSAQKFNSILIGDESLMRRPMLRVAEPLRLMGAHITLSDNNTAPIAIIGNQHLIGINYESTIPSAQVKSAILLASLYANGEMKVREKTLTRDHTEKMLKHRGNIKIPSDISSAAFFIVAACITKHSDLIIYNVGVNPFRTGIIDILKLMGANIELINQQFFGNEPVADIRIKYSPLHGITIPQDLISKSIDEFPVIFIAAVTDEGNTLLRGAKELRVKESDRIAAMVKGFTTLDIKTEEYDDGVLIFGDQQFQGGCVNSFGDHRIAMAFAIAGNIANGSVVVTDCKNIATSFPEFMSTSNAVGLNIVCRDDH